MKTKSRPGRPPLPIEERVAGLMLKKIGPLRRIRWLLIIGGQTKLGLVRDAGFKCTRERARTIFKDLHLSIPRNRNAVWRIVRLHGTIRALKVRTEQEIESLARRFANQEWLNRETKRFGSFKKLARHYGFASRITALREILRSEELRIPRRETMGWLRCNYCGKKFLRRKSVQRHLERTQKTSRAFCSRKHFYALRRQVRKRKRKKNAGW